VTCEHEHFEARVDVNRLTDVAGFHVDVRVWCVDCEQPFRWVGVPVVGLLGSGPTTNLAGTELHAPIRPADDPNTGPVPMAGYTMRTET
jgi:hypothetical protein